MIRLTQYRNQRCESCGGESRPVYAVTDNLRVVCRPCYQRDTGALE